MSAIKANYDICGKTFNLSYIKRHKESMHKNKESYEPTTNNDVTEPDLSEDEDLIIEAALELDLLEDVETLTNKLDTTEESKSEYINKIRRHKDITKKKTDIINNLNIKISELRKELQNSKEVEENQRTELDKKK